MTIIMCFYLQRGYALNTKYNAIPLGTAISTILGHIATMFGWGFFSFVMIFAWVFGGNSDTTFIHFYSELNSTQGRVVNVVETNMSVNDQFVWANVYEYNDQDGNLYVRDAFTTGYAFSINEQVDVKYVVSSPEYARVDNTRNAMLSPWGLLIFILPVIGLLIIFLGLKNGWKQYQKMRVNNTAFIESNRWPIKEVLVPVIFVGPHIWYLLTLF